MDFGAQYAHLICRRIRDMGVYAELLPFDVTVNEIRKFNPGGIILSGGPSSVFDKEPPLCDKEILDLNIPILGICYGLQLIAYIVGGEVEKAPKHEYGRASLRILDKSDLFYGLPDHIVCWMSHGDIVKNLPKDFINIAETENSPSASIKDVRKKIFGVQFHPEVKNTEYGSEILHNFIQRICKVKPNWNLNSFIESSIKEIRVKVGQDRVLCALSGGVDSSTAAILINKAIGDRLTCIFIDHGLLRKDEAKQVNEVFKENLNINLIYLDASKRFLKRLKDVEDPEEKRKIIGEEFINVFTEEGARHGDFQWLAQGTLYPDVIESSKAGSIASRIKTHHNVGGLPEKMKFKLIEPLRDLYKDEVRTIGKLLGLPEKIILRHPFPGPGLSVRIIGKVTQDKIRICRDSSWIIEDELRKRGLYDKIWQAFSVVGEDKATGVVGDKRIYGHIVTIRIVESSDAMTADWTRLPYKILEVISTRITNEIAGVSWVTYAVSSKPPSTIEPQ